MTEIEPKNKEEVTISLIDSGDMLDVFNLSNQASVRANSFNQDKIELEGHKKWFAKKLKDENSIMLKASINGIMAGQVRIDIEESNGLIGVSVSDNFRGRGIGSRLIEAAIGRAKDRDIKIIEACIKPENQASIKLFEKNGFIYDSKTEFSGCKASKYIFMIS
jgi:RimJ/RimL family protein N-acetyltransferase